METNQSVVRRVDDTRLAAALRSASSGQVAPPSSGIAPRVAINIRAATMDDLPFIDRLQKAQTREVGFLPTKAIEGKLRLGQVLLAEQGQGAWGEGQGNSNSSLAPRPSPLAPVPIGYLIAADRYFKRDEIGYITQINVLPEYRRSLVAAALLQAQFDRSAYGCKLYSCWCAQDLMANEFWEAMGFTAIAFRTGSRTRGRKSEVGGQKRPRMHIFWQKRVRGDDAGDVKNGGTPWWYPSQTGGGEMREDRLVFPIPPGVSWRDVLPVVLPGEERPEVAGQRSERAQKKPRAKKVLRAPLKGGLWFKENAIVETTALAKSESKSKQTIDPRLTAMARELRDRWTEQSQKTLPAPAHTPAKHDVRRIASDQTEMPAPFAPKLTLPQAA